MYLGEYNYGKANGYGQYRWANGNTYSGTFKDGMKVGKGIWKKSGNEDVTNTYEGEYLDDKKHGLGEFKWASGGYYRGNYANDVKTGYGEMYWSDGSIYRGTWHKGIQNGLGIMIFSNGVRKAGIFKDNVLVELLVDKLRIEEIEAQTGVQFPQSFKQELKEYIGLMNPTENNQQFLNQQYQEAKFEDKFQPNTLLQMQEISNAPWLMGAENAPQITRDEYIDMIKQQEIEEAKLDYEPSHAQNIIDKPIF